jgi:hypothetical protein
MIRMISPASLLRRFWCSVLLALVLAPSAGADTQTLTVKSKTKGPQKVIVRYFPSITGTPPAATLLVVPLLGPAKELLPNGKLIVWAGRNDGTPLSIDVTVNIPEDAGPNFLANAGLRVMDVALHTNAQGLAEAYLVAPDNPPPNAGAGGGGGGEEGGE